MKTVRQSPHSESGFTLLEMTIVILVLLTLVGVGMFSYRKMDEWKLGRTAAETLRDVYSAQRMFLSDNPTTPVASITDANLLPYMRDNPATMPTVESVEGDQLTIKVNASPPVITAGSGVVYDPSGKTGDSLWDVGK